MKTVAKAILGLSIFACAAPMACGRGESEPEPARIAGSGSITAESPADPNHMGFHYAVHSFDAQKWDRVMVELVSADFPVILKLVEASSGAPLAEWDQEYSEEEALSYTIAGPGEYEARVYSTGGFGEYGIVITLKRGGSM